MSGRYQVMPFIGKIKANQSAIEVSNQLEELLNKGAENGLEFVELSSVNIEVQPGCLAALFGAKASYVRFDMAVFKSRG